MVGRDIPTPDEIDALLQSTTDARWRALFLMAIRCGLRASELRGLRWQDIDFKKSVSRCPACRRAQQDWEPQISGQPAQCADSAEDPRCTSEWKTQFRSWTGVRTSRFPMEWATSKIIAI